MDLSAKPEEWGLPLNLAGGRGSRIPDLRLLLAVHAARQATGVTARLVSESDLPVVTNDDPARLTLLLAAAENPTIQQRMAGSFNAAVAAFLALGTEDESGVYLPS